MGRPKMPVRPCSHPGCPRPFNAKGYCKQHGAQMRKTGRTWDITRVNGRHEFCTWPECDSPHLAKGLCYLHWRRQYEGINMDRPSEITCKYCSKVVPVKRTGAIPEACPPCRRLHNRAQAYGLDWHSYKAMEQAQGGVCAICGAEPHGKWNANRLHIDHDHDTGEPRGLLCSNCNIGLGNFQDSPDALRSAAAYIESRTA